jgi:hypothetical protein
MKNKHLIFLLKREQYTPILGEPYKYYHYYLAKKCKYVGATVRGHITRVELMGLIKCKTLLLTRRFDNPVFEWNSCLLLWNNGERYK